MKKVLSVALASAMVLGLGANAFALEYNSGVNDEADWPSNFKFDGSLFVTDEDDNFVNTSSASLGSKAAADFRPGDTIWMPLYANDQAEWVVNGTTNGYPAVASKQRTYGATLQPSTSNDLQISNNGGTVVVEPFYYRDVDNKVIFYYNYTEDQAKTWADDNDYENYRFALIPTADAWVTVAGAKTTSFADLVNGYNNTVDIYANVVVFKDSAGKIYQSTANGANKDSTEITSDITATANMISGGYKYQDGVTMDAGATPSYGTLSYSEIKTETDKLGTVAADTPVTIYMKVGTATRTTTGNLRNDVNVTFVTPALKEIVANDGSASQIGDQEVANNNISTKKYGHYTGKIDKNWSINLLEKAKGAEEVIDSAEFYRADAADVSMYGKYTNEIKANAVYVKVTLKDFFDSVSDATLKYYVYVADNNGNTKSKTNEVWVEGSYENNNEKYVDFDWSNNANSPAVWKVKKGENGTAVFDFQDKVFFTVKMYSEEKMYLDLSTAYDKIVAGDFSEADFDSFFKFQGTNANFSREGQLLLASDDEDLFVYEIDADGNLIPVDAEYVKDYKIAHTNTKANGYLFNTKELGNYVLSATELEADDEEAPEEEPEDNNNDVVEEPTPDETEKPAPTPEKPNPNTGANDFVGVAVALAVVSVAAAGALALKK